MKNCSGRVPLFHAVLELLELLDPGSRPHHRCEQPLCHLVARIDLEDLAITGLRLLPVFPCKRDIPLQHEQLRVLLRDSASPIDQLCHLLTSVSRESEIGPCRTSQTNQRLDTSGIGLDRIAKMATGIGVVVLAVECLAAGDMSRHRCLVDVQSAVVHHFVCVTKFIEAFTCFAKPDELLRCQSLRIFS